AQFPGVGRALQGQRMAVPGDTAGVGLDDAVDDFHQGALAGAVLAEQSMNFACVDCELDTVVRPASGVLLDDVFQLQALCGCHSVSSMGVVPARIDDRPGDDALLITDQSINIFCQS